MSPDEELEFRQFVFTDKEGFKETYKLCFDIDVSEEYLNWKYRDNPAGEVVAFAAFSGETMAAFYGVIPETYLVNGEPKRVYQSMDTMTHPNFQRRGLFGKLAKMTYDKIVEIEGELKLVGIPGTTSYPGFVKKLSWMDIHQFKYTFCQKHLFKAVGLFGRTAKIEFKPVTEMTDSLAEFLDNRKISDKPIQPSVSSAFFDWRVFKNTNKKFDVLEIIDNGKTVGVCVYTMPETDRCFINFLTFSDDKMFADYTKTVVGHLFELTNSSFIYNWEAINPALHKALKKVGFITNPLDSGMFSYRVPFIVRAEPDVVEGLNWYDVNNYDVQQLMQD